MGKRLILFIVCSVFVLLGASACVSKSAYEKVSSQLAQTQQEKSRLEGDVASLNSTASEFKSQVETSKTELSNVKSTLSQEQAKVRDLTSQVETSKTEVSNVKSALSQEQAKVRDLTSQLEIAKAETAKLQNPVKPTLLRVRATSQTPSSTGTYTEKSTFAAGEALILVHHAVIPIHEQKWRYSATLVIKPQNADAVVLIQTARYEGEVSTGVTTVSRVGWWTTNYSAWARGTYVATVVVEDDITGARAQPALTVFALQ